MEIYCLTVGSMGTNCYLAVDTETLKTFIIDPGDEADFISNQILEKHLDPVGILLTHGHFDHCLAVLELKLNFNLPIYLHPDDLFLYEKADKSATYWSTQHVIARSKATKQPPPLKLPKIDFFIKDKDILTFGSSRLTTIHTPGHTPGSCCFSTQSVNFQPSLFSGDTLFADGVGRTDLSYSSKSDLKKSLHKISKLSPDTIIYPGHGESITISIAEEFLQ